ncbi:MAG: uncharacterized protein KVP18_000432 [Porospora cf. gigantea A]|uniref:uncharacterized protein n=1 Tax=Porospora cf. gigantea A TaxID=2853593 RepID=UPI00355A4601|nr:MAG: hypothetical protein KVP18_000432 [Porospora cf. gigantea A]
MTGDLDLSGLYEKHLELNTAVPKLVIGGKQLNRVQAEVVQRCFSYLTLAVAPNCIAVRDHMNSLMDTVAIQDRLHTRFAWFYQPRHSPKSSGYN